MTEVADAGSVQGPRPLRREFRLRTGYLFVHIVFWPFLSLAGAAGLYVCIGAVWDGSFQGFPVLGQLKFLAFGASSVFLSVIGPLTALEMLALWCAGIFSGYRVELNAEDGTVHVRGDGSATVSPRNPGRSIRGKLGAALEPKGHLILQQRLPDPRPRLLARLHARIWRLAILLRQFRRLPDDVLYVPVHALRDGAGFIQAIDGFRRL